jgi:alkylhydroperoxidase family enzyme
MDIVMGWIGAAKTPAVAAPVPVPGPRGMPAYAQLGSLHTTLDPLPLRLRHLTAQLAALRSGCAHCQHENRHYALRAGVPAAALDAVADYRSGLVFSESERAALALTDAVTSFVESDGGFPEHILARAREHFVETQIMALIAEATRQHFFDPVTGRMGKDALR